MKCVNAGKNVETQKCLEMFRNIVEIFGNVLEMEMSELYFFKSGLIGFFYILGSCQIRDFLSWF